MYPLYPIEVMVFLIEQLASILRKLLDALKAASTMPTEAAFSTYTDVVWSPSGDLLAQASSDGSIEVLNVTDGRLQVTYRQHLDWVQSLDWSPDGSRIASAGYDGDVHVWDAATGRIDLVYQGHQAEVRRVVWSPDGTRIASAGLERTIHVWDAATGQLLAMCDGHRDAVKCLAWSPDGSFLVSGSRDHSIRLWYPVNGDLLAIQEDHQGGVNDVAWSPLPGAFTFASASNDATVKVWQVDPIDITCTCILSYERHIYTGGVIGVAWTGDGRRVVSVDRRTIHEWSVHAPHAIVIMPIPREALAKSSEVFSLHAQTRKSHGYPDGTTLTVTGEGWVYLGSSPATSLTEEWGAN